MPTSLLILIAIILVGITYFATAAITRWQLAKESVNRQEYGDIRNYVLDISTETAFVRARFDPPIPTSLPTDEQIRIGFKNMINVDWNAAFALLYGYPADFDMSKVSLGERLSMSDPRNLKFTRDFVENNYSAIGHEMIGTRVSGEPIAIVASTSGVVENGHLVGLWGTMINKTALKNAELALKKSKEMFSRALELSPDAIVISRLEDGQIIDVNDGFRVLTGYSRDEVLKVSTVDMGLWEDSSRRSELLRLISENGTIRDEELRFIRKNGETITCLISADCMTIGDENCVLSVIRDISVLRS